MGVFAEKIYHGAAYYPELWPSEQVDEDIGLMKEAGINLVRVGEFAWSSMEPSEGRYELDWLGNVLDKCHEAGVAVILCTPTPTPPRWLTYAYPETLRIDIDGKPFQHGSRQHVSHVSPVFRRFSRRITEKLARTFGRHPALAGWQTDNEFLCHVDGDFSSAAEQAWHDWLKDKYGSIDNLNRLWGAAIWSEDYPDFEQVPLPGKTPFINQPGTSTGQHNCSLALDWGFFISDTVVSFQKEQVDIIREHSEAPITHNHVAFDRVFSEDLFRDLDFAATDFYADHSSLWWLFHALDWMRGAKMTGGVSERPYMILETSPSHNGFTMTGHSIHPHGFLPAEALLCLGMGGNAFCYWPWRQPRSGAEMCHGSVVTAWGAPSVGWADVRAVSGLIGKVEPILTDIPPAPALIAVHESRYARACISRGERFYSTVNTWTATVGEVHEPLLRLGLWRDVRFEDADVSSYRVVISAFMPILTDALMDRMTVFMESGGTWIVGPLSGCRTENGTVPTTAGLGRLDDIAGVRTLWPAPLKGCVGTLEGRDLPIEGYSFGLEPRASDTRVLGEYKDGAAKGAAWCVQRPVGRGSVILLAAHCPGRMKDVYEVLLRDLDLPRLNSSWGTTIIPRLGNGREAYLIANWDGLGGTAELPRRGTDLISGAEMEAGPVRVEAFGTLAVLGDE